MEAQRSEMACPRLQSQTLLGLPNNSLLRIYVPATGDKLSPAPVSSPPHPHTAQAVLTAQTKLHCSEPAPGPPTSAQLALWGVKVGSEALSASGAPDAG